MTKIILDDGAIDWLFGRNRKRYNGKTRLGRVITKDKMYMAFKNLNNGKKRDKKGAL